MRVQIFLFFLANAFLISAFPIYCPRYICTNKLSTNTACAKTNLTGERATITLKSCNDNSACDVIPSNLKETSCSPYYTNTRLYPGDYCRNKIECHSGICEKEKCKGKGENEKCKKDIDCDVGLFCLVDAAGGKCVRALKANATCKKHERCAANLVNNGTHCVQIGSVPNGKSSTVPSACRSLFIDKQEICVTGPKLHPQHKNKANVTTCHYEYVADGKKVLVLKNPICGANKDGEGYCNPGIGDVDITPVFLPWIR
eukprot:TRINITY_DN3633_c0_g2_i10.p1 TRINITY_DN3633_c0_g2~~TRINITY_DN3633_c0_g2_i10.p1  ORF type:complete len:257 (-),score=20.26 TRINITY_DN3633_c0_g2_i10:280-1050(-)